MQNTLNHPLTRLALTVDVVDGNGIEVSSQRVMARYQFEDGTESTALGTTDIGGRARFDLTPMDAPSSVTVSSGRESVRWVPDAMESHLVIEM